MRGRQHSSAANKTSAARKSSTPLKDDLIGTLSISGRSAAHHTANGWRVLFGQVMQSLPEVSRQWQSCKSNGQIDQYQYQDSVHSSDFGADGCWARSHLLVIYSNKRIFLSPDQLMWWPILLPIIKLKILIVIKFEHKDNRINKTDDLLYYFGPSMTTEIHIERSNSNSKTVSSEKLKIRETLWI